MKHTITRLLSPCLVVGTMLVPSIAFAGSFVDVNVKAKDGAVVCLGDDENPSRFGGAPVIDGTAHVLLPPRSLRHGASQLILTASDGERAGRTNLRVHGKERTTIRLGKGNAGNCTPSRLVEAADVPGLVVRFATKFRAEIMARANPKLVNDEFFSAFIDESERELNTLMKQAKDVSVIPDERLDVVAKAIEAAEHKKERLAERRRRRREIERWAAAMEELARQREERRRRAQEKKEADAAAEAAALAALKARAEAKAKEYCFGGVGQGCGKFKVGASVSWERGLEFDIDIQKSTCFPSGNGHECAVNSGSWTHDECCVVHPNGHVCGGDESSSACTDEWDRAVRRTASFFTWASYFDASPVTDGKVRFSDHCAGGGQLIEKPEDNPNDNDYGFDDRELCCSKGRRDLYPWEAAPLYTAHATLLYFEPGEMCKPK